MFIDTAGYGAQTAGGYDGGAAAGGGGGMSPGMMAGLGIGSALLGAGLSYYGERQGAKAMQAEAERQAAEQDAFGQMRHARILDQIGRFSPGEAPALGQVALQRRMAAINPALRAAGGRLGLGSADIARTGAALMPMQRLAALNDRRGVLAQRQAIEEARLGQDLGSVESRRGMAASLYDDRSALAGRRGEGYRTAGSMLSGIGMPLIGMAMGQAARNRASGDGVATSGGYTRTEGPAAQEFDPLGRSAHVSGSTLPAAAGLDAARPGLPWEPPMAPAAPTMDVPISSDPLVGSRAGDGMFGVPARRRLPYGLALAPTFGAR